MVFVHFSLAATLNLQRLRMTVIVAVLRILAHALLRVLRQSRHGITSVFDAQCRKPSNGVGIWTSGEKVGQPSSQNWVGKKGRCETKRNPNTTKYRSGCCLAIGSAAGACGFGGIAEFFSVALYFAKSINGFVLGFVIGAGTNLTQQSHRDKLNAA